MTVDELIIELALDDKKVDSGINRVKSSLSSFSGFVTGIGIAFGQLFGNMVLGLADTIPRMFNEMKEDVRVLDDISKKVNANVEDIAAWGDAIEMSGGSAKSFQHTLVSLSSDLSKLSITGKARSKPFLEALGLDPKALSAKPVMDVLQDISNAVQGMDKQTSGFALKNIGFDPDAIKFLQGGNVEGLIAKQKELGVYTDKDAEAMDKMDKSIKRISHTFKTLAIPLFSAVIDTVAKVAVYVEKAITLIRKNTDVLKGAFLALMILFSGPLLQAVQRFFTLLMAHPFMMVIAAMAGLALLLEDLWVYANEGESAFEGLWEKLGTPQEVMSGFEKIGRLLGKIGDVLADKENQMVAVLSILMGLVGALAAAIGTIPVAIAAGLALIIAYWEEISQFFADIVEAFKIVGRMIASIFEIAGKAIGDALSGAADVAKSAWSGFITWLEEKWNWIKSLLPSLAGIVSKLPSLSAAPATLAYQGSGGGTTNVSTVTDNRKVDIHNHSAAAASTSMERMELVGFGNTGVKK